MHHCKQAHIMRFYALLSDLRALVVRRSNCLESGSTKHGKFQTYCEKGLGHMHVACGVLARPVVSHLVVDLKGASFGVITNYGWPNGLVPSLGHGARDRVAGVGGAPLRRGHGPGRWFNIVWGPWWSPGRGGAGILGPARGGPAFN